MSGLLKPQVHKQTVFPDGKIIAEHAPATNSDCCAKYDFSGTKDKNKVSKRTHFAFTYVINDTLCVDYGFGRYREHGLVFKKVIAQSRMPNAPRPSGYECPEDKAVTATIEFKEDAIELCYYDCTMRHSNRSVHICKGPKAVQNCVDHWKNDGFRVRNAVASATKADISKTYVLDGNSMVGDVVCVRTEQLNSTKVEMIFTWLQTIYGIEDAINKIDASVLTPEQIYQTLGKIFSKPELAHLFQKIEYILEHSVLELGSTPSEKDQKYMQSVLNGLRSQTNWSPSDDINDGEFKWMQDSYNFYRGKEAKVINVNKLAVDCKTYEDYGMGCKTDVSKRFIVLKHEKEDDDLSYVLKNKALRAKIREIFCSKDGKSNCEYYYHYGRNSFVQSMTEADIDKFIHEMVSTVDRRKDHNDHTQHNKFHYIIGCGDKFYTTLSLMRVRNFLKNVKKPDNELISCHTHYVQYGVGEINDLEMLFLTC